MGLQKNLFAYVALKFSLKEKLATIVVLSLLPPCGVQRSYQFHAVTNVLPFYSTHSTHGANFSFPRERNTRKISRIKKLAQQPGLFMDRFFIDLSDLRF